MSLHKYYFLTFGKMVQSELKDVFRFSIVKHIDVFISSNALVTEQEPRLAFGNYSYCDNASTVLKINIVTSLGINYEILRKLKFNIRKSEKYGEGVSYENYELVGVINFSREKLNGGLPDALKKLYLPIVSIVTRERSENPIIYKVWYRSHPVCESVVNTVLIIYDLQKLELSELIKKKIMNDRDYEGYRGFVAFLLVENSNVIDKKSRKMPITKFSTTATSSRRTLLRSKCRTVTDFLFVCINSSVAKVSLSLVSWISSCHQFYHTILYNKALEGIKETLKKTATGHQFYVRRNQLLYLQDSLHKDGSVSLRSGNIISSIMLDLFLGFMLIGFLLKTVKVDTLLDDALEVITVLVNTLQELIFWLMGVPAGLKLNKPLNDALGHFFMYHIYLWKTYISVLKPFFAFILESFIFIGICGVTFHLSLLSDLLSVATIHIYCFYGYATRLYGLQVSGLSALWRLFRGKKWNPLRNRVDSHEYSHRELFIGTMLFTVLLFLLPTTLIYYCVFSVLRIIVLIVEGLVKWIVKALNLMPLYVIILRIFKSDCVAGEVFFTICHHSSNDRNMTLKMQLVQVPYGHLIKQTLPVENENNERLIPSWTTLLVDMITGKIIYPL
ncbi:phosphatidylinositol glycan anchor biosynthesis class Q [Tachypleus tridentatus]|uniref:phosphatidylinositol glycan anchor biosynthesis class Q n=1 Tax=Tachypleus tridentatus TaxID=6853 RepID=UPI003FD2F95F